MANVIKLNKGLDINLKGRAEEKKIQLKSNGKFALVPDDFEGVTPKVVVREGDKVKAGTSIALVGNTGSLTTGDHLHFELWHNGIAINPADYMTIINPNGN